MTNSGIQEVSKKSDVGSSRSGAMRSDAIHSLPTWNLRAISNLERIGDLAPVWRGLTPPGAAPFQTFGWNHAWYTEFADEYDEALVLLLSQGREARAILPLYRKGTEIRLAGDRTCDYQDIVALRGADADRVLDFAIRWLLCKRPGCRFVLERLSSEGWLHQLLLERGSRDDRFFFFAKFFAPCPKVSLGSSRDDYLESLKGKMRQDLRRCIRKLYREAPGARWWIRRHPEIDTDQVSELAAFHERHFRLDGTSPCADERLRRLLGRVAEDPDVGFQIAGLESDDRLVAVDFGFARGERFYGYLTGFDSEFRSLSPGKCLLIERIDSWIREDGVATLDFLSGSEPYKRGFTHGEGYRVVSVHLLPVTLRNRVRHARLVLDREARRLAKWFLRRVGLRRS